MDKYLRQLNRISLDGLGEMGPFPTALRLKITALLSSFMVFNRHTKAKHCAHSPPKTHHPLQESWCLQQHAAGTLPCRLRRVEWINGVWFPVTFSTEATGKQLATDRRRSSLDYSNPARTRWVDFLPRVENATEPEQFEKDLGKCLRPLCLMLYWLGFYLH